MRTIQGQTQFEELCELVGFDHRRIDDIYESLDDQSHEHTNYCVKEIINEVLKNNHLETLDIDIDVDQLYDWVFEYTVCTVAVEEIILNAIEEALNNRFTDVFEPDVFDMIHLEFSKEHLKQCVRLVKIEIACDPDSLMRKGMSAYGMWDYDAHSADDKVKLWEPYYLIREGLHYVEACDRRIHIDYDFDWDDVFEFPDYKSTYDYFEERILEWAKTKSQS